MITYRNQLKNKIDSLQKLINEIRDVHIEGFINDEVMSAILC